jgi:predicted Zn-ribbon and HTH transcriptional regulator
MPKEIDRMPIIHNGTLTTYPIYNTKDILALLQAKCLRCGNTWNIRTEHPKRCPKCKSPYWNKPRRKPKQ